MEAKDFQVGDEVLTSVDNQDVNGTVESIQLGKNLVDVKIYQPGHRSHCLIVARPSAEVKMRNQKESKSKSA